MADHPLPPTFRLFIALELPLDWRAILSRAQRDQERINPGYFRWVATEQLHVTIVFLGRLDARRLEDLVAGIQRASESTQPLELRLAHLGSFGALQSPRVLYAALSDPAGGLRRLRASLEAELDAAAVSFDRKPLVPHITLGRARKDGRRLSNATSNSIQTARHVFRSVTLFQSDLTPSGPVYTARSVLPLSQEM